MRHYNKDQPRLSQRNEPNRRNINQRGRQGYTLGKSGLDL
jgi:hypothetical protein